MTPSTLTSRLRRGLRRLARPAAGLALAGATWMSAHALGQESVQVPYSRSGQVGVPDYHVVQTGDTLWDITDAYYGNAYLWPMVWSYNPQITNPHWIYPGDIIFLRPAADSRGLPHSGEANRAPGRPGTHYPLGGFYTGTELETVGFIRFSTSPYRSLTLLDDVFMAFDDRDSVRVGDRFALNRVIDRIIDDERDEVVAVKYRVTGVVEVTAIPDDAPLVQGRIIQAWDVIERGDVLFVNQRHMRVVEPAASNVTLEATMIDFLEPMNYAAGTYYVFIDRGYNQGVREGNLFTVWDRTDEYVEFADGEPGYEEEDHIEDMPWQPMGQAIVIFTTDDYATAVLTSSRRELRRGMRVTLTEGY